MQLFVALQGHTFVAQSLQVLGFRMWARHKKGVIAMKKTLALFLASVLLTCGTPSQARAQEIIAEPLVDTVISHLADI